MKECLYLQQQLSQILKQTPQQQNSPNPSQSSTANIGTMPCWYYDKKDLKDTPSVLDGITLDTERRYRKVDVRFIMSCGTEMGLGHNTIATGVVNFHRFYMFHSFKSFPRSVTACCCLFLAGKVEETPKKCRDIIKTARERSTDTQFYSFVEDKTIRDAFVKIFSKSNEDLSEHTIIGISSSSLQGLEWWSCCT